MCFIIVLPLIISYRSTISSTLITPIDSHLMIRRHTVAEYHALPVRIISGQIAFHFFLIPENIPHAHQIRIINSGISIRISIVSSPFLQLDIFGTIHYIIFLDGSCNTIIPTVTNIYFTLVPPFRCNQEYTIRTTGTVNSRCRSILQDADTFHVIIIDFVQPARKRDSIYHNQNIVTAIERTFTTHTNLRSSTRMRIATCHLYINTGCKPLQRRTYVTDRCLLQRFALYIHHSSGNVGLLLGAITDHHHFIQHLGIISQYDLD